MQHSMSRLQSPKFYTSHACLSIRVLHYIARIYDTAKKDLFSRDKKRNISTIFPFTGFSTIQIFWLNFGVKT